MLTLPVFAQKVKTVKGEFTYHASENVSMAEAKRQARIGAQNQAIGDEFGTLITDYSMERIKEKNGESSNLFSHLGGSEVKGEWLEDIDEPVYTTVPDNGMVAVTCKVHGRAREIVTAPIDLKVHLLRNGTDDRRNEDDRFRAGDDIYLSFMSPVAGSLAVYLLDEDDMVTRILPYPDQPVTAYPIEADQRYVFWDPESAKPEERALMENGLQVTCEGDAEYNIFYFVFSPNKFTKAVDKRNTHERYTLPPQLSFTDFNKWLVKNRKADKDMNAPIVPILITADGQ